LEKTLLTIIRRSPPTSHIWKGAISECGG